MAQIGNKQYNDTHFNETITGTVSSTMSVPLYFKPVQSMLKAMDGAINDVEQMCRQLEERLQPVLAVETPEPKEAPLNPEAGSSDMLITLRGETERLLSLQKRLSSLLWRLEI